MAAIEFVQNYDDLSTDQGFQFKFYCDRCGNGFQSHFIANKVGMAGGILRAAGGLLGGILGSAGDSAYEIQRAVGGPAHDKALKEAVQEIKPLFNQCRRCGQWVCQDICWNKEKGLCKQCAPVLSEEIASAQANAASQQIYEKAMAADLTQGIDVTQATAAQCPNCGAETSGAKFCPECGASLAPKGVCSKCSAKIPAGAKFCPECGARA
ncbi:MAG: zinc ribbon domain-containing protein [Armatimonadetes bacterium]|nr:zinc ribbon domain-containing protein [Armatimonadota bacterium]